MINNANYQSGLLYLIHLLISADGVVDEKEKEALTRVRFLENIPDEIVLAFEKDIATKKEKEIYTLGIDLINQCTDEEKLRAFVHLYKLTEVDGNIHIKEVRLLLYSVRKAGIEFDDVVKQAAMLSAY